MVVGMVRPHKILIVVTGSPPPAVAAAHGDYATIMAAAVGSAWTGGYDSIDLRSERPRNDSATAAVIITGSSASLPDHEPWMAEATAWLAEIVRRGTPTLGVCFGHQLLAQALGGAVALNPKGREMGTVAIERLEPCVLFQGLNRHFTANACHTDTVTRLPVGAEVFARSETDPHQCVRFAERCYGVQFHPEIDGWTMRAFVDARADQLHAEGLDPVAIKHQARDTPSGHQIMGNFVKHVVALEGHEAHLA